MCCSQPLRRAAFADSEVSSLTAKKPAVSAKKADSQFEAAPKHYDSYATACLNIEYSLVFFPSGGRNYDSIVNEG